jgi:hypothetical protein
MDHAGQTIPYQQSRYGYRLANYKDSNDINLPQFLIICLGKKINAIINSTTEQVTYKDTE